ncbi:hypothetical protein GCWU000341_02076 [Oribacterium sp. oral taxon 078 str. F0262]|nr:hypothetical protein GCWU000341_02076 [Oribacterium sp. oral taxon 078 str. F0262]
MPKSYGIHSPPSGGGLYSKSSSTPRGIWSRMLFLVQGPRSAVLRV